MLKVGLLKKFLKNKKNTTEVTVFLNIVDEKSNYLIGVLFDVDSIDMNGLLIEISVSGKVQDLEKYNEDAKKTYLKK